MSSRTIVAVIILVASLVATGGLLAEYQSETSDNHATFARQGAITPAQLPAFSTGQPYIVGAWYFTAWSQLSSSLGQGTPSPI